MNLEVYTVDGYKPPGHMNLSEIWNITIFTPVTTGLASRKSVELRYASKKCNGYIGTTYMTWNKLYDSSELMIDDVIII